MADGKITGTLIYNDGWESGPLAGPGYFMALKFSSEDWDNYDSIMVGLDPSIGTGLVEVKNDPNKNGVFKVSARDTQKFIVQTRVGSITTRTQYNLSELIEVNPTPEPEILTIPSDETQFAGKPISDYEDISFGSYEGNDYYLEGTSKEVDDLTNPSSKKHYLLLESKDHVSSLTSSLKSVTGGETTVITPSQDLSAYYSANTGIMMMTLSETGIETVGSVDDIYLEVTLDGTTEKYHFKDIIFETTPVEPLLKVPTQVLPVQHSVSLTKTSDTSYEVDGILDYYDLNGYKHNLMLESVDHVASFDNMVVKGVLNGETATFNHTSFSVNYYGEDGLYPWCVRVGMTTTGESRLSTYDDVYLEVTKGDSVQTYSFKWMMLESQS